MNKSTKALIIVDFEKEWIDKNSEYFVGNISSVIKKINKLIDFCRNKGYKIVFTTHVEKDSDGAFKKNTKNVEIIDGININKDDTLITKYKISPFYQTNLDKVLKGIEEIVVGGILTNLCVRSLVQDAYDRDFKITVIKDVCVAFNNETQEFTFKDLKATREEIEFLNLEEFIKYES